MPSDDPKLEAFATLWETQGLEDQPVELGRTQTMRATAARPASASRRTTAQLPTLVARPGEDTTPEIELDDVLGVGGMGEVRLATQVPVGRQVAVKSPREAAGGSQSALVMLREGWITGLLEHPNVVPIYTLGRGADGQPMIVMKRIEGVAWSTLLADPSAAPRQFDSDDPLDWHLEILGQVCNAVHFAHSKGIIHRDIKPDNVMLGAFGEVYLLDWGIAVSIDDDASGRLPSVSEIESPVGTPHYVAPEMAGVELDKIGPATDIFLLGATLHEILTGTPPNRGESLFKVLFDAYNVHEYDYGDDVPEQLAAICQKAMAREPADRFESAEELRVALAEFSRHRESLRLSDEALARLDTLRTLARDEEASDARLYKVFGECRFGFEQALEIDADNERARQGLQVVLVEMIEREIDRGAYQAASLLIADLPEERPDLSERLEELGRRLDDREQEFEELKREQFEASVEVSRHARSIFAALLGAIWGTISVVRWLVPSMGGQSPSYTAYITELGVVAAAVALAIVIGRKGFFQNSANRKMIAAFVLVFLGSWCQRMLGAQTHSSIVASAIQETIIFGVGGGVMAITLDKRLWWAVVPYVAGSVIAVFSGDYMHLLFGLTNYVALGLLAWAWWPADAKSKSTSVTPQ